MIFLVLLVSIYFVILEILNFLEQCSKLGHPGPRGEQLEHDDGIGDKCSDRPPNCMAKEGRSC
jgi:hypothetical protein